MVADPEWGRWRGGPAITQGSPPLPDLCPGAFQQSIGVCMVVPLSVWMCQRMLTSIKGNVACGKLRVQVRLEIAAHSLPSGCRPVCASNTIMMVPPVHCTRAIAGGIGGEPEGGARREGRAVMITTNVHDRGHSHTLRLLIIRDLTILKATTTDSRLSEV